MDFLKYTSMFATFLARGVVFYSKQNFRAKILIGGQGLNYRRVPDAAENVTFCPLEKFMVQLEREGAFQAVNQVVQTRF